MATNSHLYKAKKAKNDEFYTLFADIEQELDHYKQCFKDKIIYCNCDNPLYSEFWKYFYINFSALCLRKLITTHYVVNGNGYKTEYDGITENSIALDSNGDFRSDACIEILKESDIVVTNPPFSLFREYIKQLIVNIIKTFLLLEISITLLTKNYSHL